MGVAAEDGGEASGLGVEVKPGGRVNEVEEMAFELECFSGGEGGARGCLTTAGGIDVAADGGDGARERRVSRIAGSPTSPRWRMWSAPAMAERTSGRRRPWVSERTAMRMRGVYVGGREGYFALRSPERYTGFLDFARMTRDYGDLEGCLEAGAGVEVVAEGVA